jgi:hypothetical protein
MDTRTLSNVAKGNLFHPSMFETTEMDVPDDKRTLQLISKERGQRLTSKDLNKLESPGTYDFTIDDKTVSGSNTRFLFKNLYGETPLTFLFFSSKNIENLQNMLKYVVHRETGYIIDNQSNNELMIIMRSIFLEYSLHPKLIDDNMSENEKNDLLQKYKNEVARLNTIVINAIVPKVVSQIQQYLDYLRDANEQPYQMDQPKNENVKGEKQYRSITQVLIGGEL